MTKRRTLRRRKSAPSSSRSLNHETLEKRELLAAEFGVDDGPRLISVAANAGELFDLDGNNVLSVAPTELTFRFDGAQPLDESTLSGIRIVASGGDGTFDDGNETLVTPGFLGFESADNARIVVARFAETLADDQYAIEVAGFDDTDPNNLIVGLRNTNGDFFSPADSSDPSRPTQTILLNIEVGPRVEAVVPQPIEGAGTNRTQLANTIDVYFNNDPLSNPNAGPIDSDSSPLPVVQERFYQLVYTNDTIERTDDGAVIVPESSGGVPAIVYDPVLNRARLTFRANLDELVPAFANGSGTFRLRIGSGEAISSDAPLFFNAVADAGDTFGTAQSLDATVTFGASSQSVVIQGGDIRANQDIAAPWPGAADVPGLRRSSRDGQQVGRNDTNTGINVFEYNFANLYGQDPQGNNLNNAITPIQRQRTREILGLYSERLGVEFIETEDSGLQIVTGDIRALSISADTGSGTPFSVYRVNDADPSRGVLVLDAGENWFNGYGLSDDANRPSWFVEALRGIGSLLGLGNTFELPPGDATGGSSPQEPNFSGFSVPTLTGLPLEPDFLTQGNVISGQALHRPEANDIDLYRFTATNDGRLTAEAFAQRLEASSLLDTHLELYRVVDEAAGQFALVATNDDFFSDDSFIGVDLQVERDSTGNPVATEYILGVSASGNDEYDGRVEGSGLGGVTEGRYDLRLTFVPQTGDTITDTTGTALDGDADGEAGGDFNFFFRVARDVASPAVDEARVIFVDKLDGDDVLGTGTLDSPLNTISLALERTRPGDIVRLLPNAGADGLFSTREDNLAYEIGRGGSGDLELSDGGEFEVPQGVTVLIDAGAILKFRSAGITVGSTSVDEDRSLAALQILGTPESPLDENGNPLVEGIGTVFFTSFDDDTIGLDTNGLDVAPQPGNWAGIEFRNDIDFAEGRDVYELEGIFLDYSSHAEIRFGGGAVSPTEPAVSPFSLAESRPTLIYNTIIDNAEAAISADPNSFLETNFHEPRFQRAAPFTSDYDRVGPEISSNTLLRNTTNGLFIRVDTPATGETEALTVSARFDDRDIVHSFSQVLALQGQPGGPLLLENRPDVLNVTFSPETVTDPSQSVLVENLTYDYRLTFVTSEGRESLASLQTSLTAAPAGLAIRLDNLPAAPAEFTGRNLYRLNPVSGEYDFISSLDRTTTFFVDKGEAGRGILSAAAEANSRLLPRFDARLSIDPGLIIKLENAGIEAGFGSDFYAEGLDGDPIVFTSRLDDSYGAGGTFDTNNDPAAPGPGDWGGLVFRQDSTGSLDHTELRFGGGQTPIDGGFAESNPVEILQADVRIAHSVFVDNADGFSGQSIRAGRGFNGPGTIFVRGSQPIIVDNTIIDNEGAAISINPDALDFTDNLDQGRSTGFSDVVLTDLDNQGPLIEGNQLDRNGINGLLVRSEVLQTESIWDDTDIVHVVDGQIVTATHQHRGGLRLRSDANQSLVVKFDNNGRLTGTGRPLDIEDRIGGTLQVLGQPGFPVILTSLADDSVGAGFTPEGIAQTNTDNADNTPEAGDWVGVELLSYLNDRNVAYVLENERAIAASVTENAIADDAQVIGSLANDEASGNENERLGFNIRGTLASDDDQDVYQFEADGGTIVYIDIDDTSYGLDTIVELIDINDQVLASSDNSFTERTDPTTLISNLPPGSVRPLFNLGIGNVETENGLDAGLRVQLDGAGANNDYFVRVRSRDASSSGQYQLSIRLRETDEVAGSTVQLADIRFATNAITVNSAPLRSPLTSEGTENLNFVDGNALDVDNAPLTFTNADATRIGNLLTSDRASLRVSGTIGNIEPTAAFQASDDIDVFQVDLFRQDISPDVFDSEIRFVETTFDVDYADGLGRVNTSLAVFDAAGQLILHSRDSNIADDVGRPLQGDDNTNLAGGSVGVLDAHIGPVALPEGTYFVAVSSAIAVPQALDQFFLQEPTFEDVRLVPINSVRRIAEDSIETFSQFTAEAPIIEPIFGAANIPELSLDDLRLFVTFDGGITGNNLSTLASFNPFTGVAERLIGEHDQPIGDIATRRDGELFAFSLGPAVGNEPQTPANTGNLLNFSSADGSVTMVGDDGIGFQRNNIAGDNLEGDPEAELEISAIAFPLGQTDGEVFNTTPINVDERFLVVGERDNRGRGEITDAVSRNLLFLNQTSTGAVTSRGSLEALAHRTFDAMRPFDELLDATTTADIELGIVDTGEALNSGGDGGLITGIGVVPPASPAQLATNPNLLNGNDVSTVLAVTDRGGVHFFDYLEHQIPGSSLNIIPTTFFGVVEPDPVHAAQGAVTSPLTGGVVFTGATLGPRTISDGQFRQTLFATTQDGWLYGLEIDGGDVVPANVFFNGRAAIPLTFGGFNGVGRAPNGLSFTTLEDSPFSFSTDREDQFNIGLEPTFDGSRIDTEGGNTLFFGFEVDGDAANNTLERAIGDPLGQLSPGGIQGSIISQPFNLEGYSPDDKPTLYFSYHAEVEADDDFTGPDDRQNDSFRVFASGDDGNWILLATNNNFRDPLEPDEFDQGFLSGIPVQELFDYDNAPPGTPEDEFFRQARVDISPLAGNENVRIRFDFSSSGNFRNQAGSFELVAVDGDTIDDNEILILNDSLSGQNVQFETIVGRDLLIPDGSLLSAGDQFVLNGPNGNFAVTFVNGPATAPGDVSFNAAQSAQEIAENVVAAIPINFRPVSDGGGRVSVLAANNVIVMGDTPVGQGSPVALDLVADQLVFPDGQFLSSGDEFTVSGLGTSTRVVLVEAADATGAPEEFIFSTTDSALDLATGLIGRFPIVLDPILDPAGRITFISGPITFDFVAAPPTNMVTATTLTQNRLELLLPDGDALIDGSTLTINSEFGSATVEFVLNAASEGPGTVNFTRTDSPSPGDVATTPTELATRLLAELPAELSGLLNSVQDGILVFGNDAIHSADQVIDQPIGAESITLPGGNVPLQNDSLTLIGEMSNFTVNFDLVATPMAPVIDPVNQTSTVFFTMADTPETIAANVNDAIPDATFITTVSGDTVLVHGAAGSSTSDPDSMIVNDATQGQFILLPDDPDDIEDDEVLVIQTATETITIEFEDQDASVPVAPGGGLGIVGFAQAVNRADLNALLLDVLPSSVRAIITPDNTIAGAVQILNALEVTATDPDTIVQVGPNAFSQDIISIEISDGVDLVDGEQLQFDLPGTENDVTITFVRSGSTAPPVGDVQVFFDDNDLGPDLFEDILEALPQEYQAFVAFDGNSISIASPDATVTVLDAASGFQTAVDPINQVAIPITVPDGASLNDGETISIIAADDLAGTNPITITFNQGVGTPAAGEVLFQNGDTAEQIATGLQAALPLNLQAFLSSGREVFLLNASSVATQPGSAIASFDSAAGTIPVLVDSTLSSEQIAPILQVALAQGLGRLATLDGSNFATPDQFPINGGDRIRIFQATPVDTGSYGVSAFGGFGATVNGLSATPVDSFGEDLPNGFAEDQIDSEGGANNQVEGIYIDDITVGFAERGEIVLNAPTDLRDFVLNPETIPETRPEAVQPERRNETLTGGFSLEVRTSDEFGVPDDFGGLTLEARLGSLGRSFDTNDRLADGAVSLIAQAGIDLLDGDTFVVDNGFDQLTFEFDSILQPGVTIGNVPVAFDPASDQSFDTAAAIRDAINSPQSVQTLGITASTGDSLEVGNLSSAVQATSDRVELFGESIMINPGSGRFTKLDLVAEETFQGRATARLIPVVDHDAQTVVYQNFGDQPARAAVADFSNGETDVLVAVGRIGDQVLTGQNAAGQGPLPLITPPTDDIDFVRIFVQAGQTIDIDVDSVGFGRGAEQLTVPVITVFDPDDLPEFNLSTNPVFNVNQNNLAQSSPFIPTAAPGEANLGAFLQFTAPEDGFYDVAISSGVGFGDYQLTIRPEASSSPEIPDRDVVTVDYQFGIGDVNRVSEQGQLIISSNIISDSAQFGVQAVGGRRGEALASVPDDGGLAPDGLPVPGATALLRNENANQLIPGTVISNNLIVEAGMAGITFTGGTQNDGEVPAPVPIGRIVNNTVVGDGGGSGIIVASTASPTLLNNLVSGFATGLNIDASSENAGTVVGGNAFQNNGTNSTIPLDSTSIVIAGEVFQEPERRIFIPAAGSAVIDSSFSSLDDRADFVDTVTEPVGIAPSPIIAPLFDAFGQPRFDDPLVNPAGPAGGVVTIDRGAVDRADQTQPIAVLTNPEDAISTVVVGGDQDASESFVRLLEGAVEFFEIQLLDEAGTGPDPETITPESVLITENGIRLIPDVDFTFGYSDNSRTIRLTPLAGLWLPDAVYEITLNNQDRIAFESPAGAEINDGDQILIVDNEGNQVGFEYESGFSLQVPQSSLLTIIGANNDFVDREEFTISGDNGNSVTFEINLAGATAGGNVAVDLTTASTAGEVRDAILAALNGDAPGTTTPIVDFLNIAPTPVGIAQIQLGLLSDHVAPTPIPGLEVSGQPGGVVDGETFTYAAAAVETPVTFEFDDDGSVATDNVAIPFARTNTPDQIAEAIVAAVSSAGLDLGGATATQLGIAVLGGSVGDTLDASSSSLVQSGTPGVTGSLTLAIPPGSTGSDVNGDTFSITVDGTTVNFLYTTDPNIGSTDELIFVNVADGVVNLAAATTAAIAEAFPDRLAPTAEGGTITLGEAQGVLTTVDPGNVGNAGLIISGFSGGAIPVSFLADSPPTSAAASLVGAIEGAVADGVLNVEAFAAGGGTILISNVASLQGGPGGAALADIGTFTPAVADLAGNPVRETRSNNETRFSIIMPEVVFDLGDAPESFGTLLADNGARHTIGSSNLPRLGRFVDSEVDGQPTNLDDSLLVVTAAAADVDRFTIDSTTTPGSITTTFDSLPRDGELLRITIDGVTRQFEFVDSDSLNDGTDGNILLEYTIDPAQSDADNLNTIISEFITLLGDSLPEIDSSVTLSSVAGGFTLQEITASVTVEGGLFVIEPLPADNTVSITIPGLPLGGELLDVTVAGLTRRFELIDQNSNPAAGNIPVVFTIDPLVSDAVNIQRITDQLIDVFSAVIPQIDDGLTITGSGAGSNVILIESIDDEDGVLIGDLFLPSTSETFTVFLDRNADPENIEPTDVLGFLNPEDPAGTNVDILVAGSGLLQIWIDFNRNGIFEDDDIEQVVRNLPVSGDPIDGSFVTVNINTPSSATDGDVWMRVRISESGDLGSTGIAVGGEVEDHLVEIISVPPPIPNPDPEPGGPQYILAEDTVLDTLAEGLPSVSENDQQLNQGFLPDQFILGSEPANGTVVIDPDTGHFVYTPVDDFFGVDTFTYRISTQQNESLAVIDSASFATVTVIVTPVNDAPSADNADILTDGITALEDVPRIITAADLLAGSMPDAEPLFTNEGTTEFDTLFASLLNEANQQETLSVAAIIGADGTPITATNATSVAGNLSVSSTADGLAVSINNVTTSDSITLGFAGTSATFELVPIGGDAQIGTVPVDVLVGDTPTTVATRLATTIANTFAAGTPSLTTTSNANTVEISLIPLTTSAVDGRDDVENNELIATSVDAQGVLTIDFLQAPVPTPAPTTENPLPDPGDLVTVNVGAETYTFEFLAEGATAADGNIGIQVLPFAGAAPGNPIPEALRQAAAIQLSIALDAALRGDNLGALASIEDLSDPVSVEVIPAIISAAKAHQTPRGTVAPLFDARGDLIEVRYLSGLDLNRNNPPTGAVDQIDEFSYQIRDNRLSIQLVDQTLEFGAEALSEIVTVSIDVAPQNDAPVLVNDQVDTFEDTPLTIIQASALLGNDLQARASAGDENVPGSLNDGALSLQSVNIPNPAQGTAILSGGDILFTPAANIFGEVLLTYAASDQGINEDLDGVRDPAFLTTDTGTITVMVAPVNDPPTANPRSFTFAESADAGVGPAFEFTSSDLIQGAAGEIPNAAGDFPSTLGTPFNESDQTLRIASFTTSDGTINEADVNPVGLQTLELRSEAGLGLDPVDGGRFEFDFFDGVFTVGRFFPAADFNQDFPLPTLPVEELTYVVADNLTPLVDAMSDTSASEAIITFNVTPTNDAPTFTIVTSDGQIGGLPALNVLEDDDGAQFPNFAQDILGGSATALDETRDQSVRFEFDPDNDFNEAAVDSGLLPQLPTLSDDGTLTVFLGVDQIGIATLVVTAIDDVASPDTRETDQTFVINVRPVNDAPRFESNLSIPVSDSLSPDDSFSIARVDFDGDDQIDDATITYTLPEDNTQAEGDTSQDFFIPLRAGSNIGFNRAGLLDVFNVGPTNEADSGVEGGGQTLNFLQAGLPPVDGEVARRTDRGGLLTPVFDNAGGVIGLNYRPPTDFNFDFAGLDSFTYTVIDGNTGGETFDPASGQLISDPLTATNTVNLRLNAVNDRPEFNTQTLSLEVQEDTSVINLQSYATEISAGPADSAFDETDPNTGQLVEFSVTLLGFSQEEAEDLFTVFPTINAQSGLLTFQPAPDVFGSFEFEIVLNDFNRDGTQSDNSLRGDLISSIPVTATITVNPVNDPPVVDPTVPPLDFQILETGALEILFEGDNTNPGLIDLFLPGPSVGNTDEAALILPQPGGNQTVMVALDTIPATSAANGVITLDDSGPTNRLIYTPAPNFVGTDSIIYTVIDDGQTVGIDGALQDDPQIAINTVTIEVLPVNDAPIFSGAEDVTVDEDQGLVVIPAWASNVLAGPTTAFDEIQTESFEGQDLEFVFTLISDNPELFETLPSATRQMAQDDGDPNTPLPILRDFDLSFQTVADANGVAVFEVVLEDDGPRDVSIGDEFQSTPVRTFTINITPVNDPPTINVVNETITIDEDSGPFTTVQIDPFSVGPEDEQSQTIQFQVQPLSDEFAALFTEQPSIDNEGVLRFTTAPNSNSGMVGPVPITVVASDTGDGSATTEATFNIVINEVDDSPSATGDSFTVDEDTALPISSAELTANDEDPDLLTNPDEFNRVVLPPFSTSASGAAITFDQETGNIIYDPTQADLLQALAPGGELRDSFTYSLVDSTGLNSNLVTVEVIVTGINDAPILGLDTPTLNPDGPTTIPLLDNDNDVDGTIDAGSIQISLPPAFGSLSFQPDGTVVYTPFGAFDQEDLFRYTVADDLGARSEEQTVSISANQSPVANDEARGTFLDESVLIDVAANDFDPDGELDLAGVTIVRTPIRGEAVPQGDGTVLYLPDAGFTGIDTFEYRIADQEGRLSNIAEVTVQVVSSRLQNPDQFSDVNDDGLITAIDALLIINRLATAGVGEIPVEVDDRGPNFFDVSGNQSISALDALQVINELARINNPLTPDGEQVAFLSEAESEEIPGESTEDSITTIVTEVEERLSDFSVPSVEIDQAIDSLIVENEERENQILAVDEVLTGLE